MGFVLLRRPGLGYSDQPDHGVLRISVRQLVHARHGRKKVARFSVDVAGDLVDGGWLLFALLVFQGSRCAGLHARGQCACLVEPVLDVRPGMVLERLIARACCKACAHPRQTEQALTTARQKRIDKARLH